MRYCTKCGSGIDDGQKFCVSCGQPVHETQNTLESMGILNNEQPASSLFDKMETNNQMTATQEEIEKNKQEQIIQKQQQEREFARAYIEKQNSLSSNYFLGLVGALLGALVGAIPWAIVSSQGWFVAWLGYIIAIAASKGFDLMKVKTSMKKLWCVAGAVIIGVLAGQIMSDMIVIAMDEELGVMFSTVLEYYAENFGEYLSVIAPNLFLGYVFAALGAFSVLKDIKKETAIINELRSRSTEGSNYYE